MTWCRPPRATGDSIRRDRIFEARMRAPSAARGVYHTEPPRMTDIREVVGDVVVPEVPEVNMPPRWPAPAMSEMPPRRRRSVQVAEVNIPVSDMRPGEPARVEMYPDLYMALRQNGLCGQHNDGRQYIDYAARFAELGIVHPDQLRYVGDDLLHKVGLMTQAIRLYSMVFR